MISLNPRNPWGFFCLWGPRRELFLVSVLFPKVNKCESQVAWIRKRSFSPLYLGRDPWQLILLCPPTNPAPPKKAGTWQAGAGSLGQGVGSCPVKAPPAVVPTVLPCASPSFK